MLAGKLIIKALEDFGVLEQFCIGMFFASKKECRESDKPIEEIVTRGKELILQEATLPNVLDRGNISIFLRESFKRRQGAKFHKIIYEDIPPILSEAALLWRNRFFKDFIQFLIEENVRYSFERKIFDIDGATFEDISQGGVFASIAPARWISGTIRYYTNENSNWKNIDERWKAHYNQLDNIYSDEVDRS